MVVEFSDYDYALLMAAVKAISGGSGLSNLVVGPDYGRKKRIDRILEIAASAKRDEYFNDDDVGYIDRLFLQLQITRGSNRIADCARQIFDNLHNSASK